MVAKYICGKLVEKRVSVPVVAKYICGKLVEKRVSVAMVAKYIYVEN